MIKELRVNKKKIKIIPSASSLNFRFKALKRKKKYKVGYFGSLEKSKGSEFVIELAKIDKINEYYIYGGKKNDIQRNKKKK